MSPAAGAEAIMPADNDKIVPFIPRDAEPAAASLAAPSPDEHGHRVITEAKRLSGLATIDWKFQLRRHAQLLSIPVEQLRELVEAEIKDRENAAKQQRDRD